MCGRFSVNIDYEGLKERYPNHKVAPVKPFFNFAPTMQLPVIINDDVINMKWGLIPSWAKDNSFASKMINARSETLLEKPSFKNLVDTNRCVIISNGFYEWDTKTKSPYFIYSTNNKIMAFGGLYSAWINQSNETIYTFTIITTEPNNTLSKIHHRMPLILNEGDDIKWINNNNNYESVKDLIKSFEDYKIDMYEISTLVNSVKNDNSEIQSRVNRLF